ncbi:unnamed protein product [Agarophyton chilense]
MEPLDRVVFTFPIYGLDLLPGAGIVVAGGGGRMKSGIPNVCQVLTFDEKKIALTPTAMVEISDAAVALSTHENVIHLAIGPGVKDYSFVHDKLVPVSSFQHDLQVSTSVEQTAIAASEDASTLIIASDDGSVVVLRLERFEPVFSGRIHTNGINDLCVSSDGSLVATTGRDKAAHIWRSRDGEILQTLKPVMPISHRTHIRAIRFCSMQSDIVFSAESNPRKGAWIAAWRKPSPSETTLYSPVAKIRASNDALTAMSVNTDGSLVASSSAEGHVSLFSWNGTAFSRMWSTETRTNFFRTPKPPHILPVTGMRFSVSGKHVFAASADYTVSVWPTRLPTRWSRCVRVFFWITSILVLVLAMLIVEDEHLHEEVRKRRAMVVPYMEPHLSEVQRAVRPLLQEGNTAIQPHLTELKKRTVEYTSRLSQQTSPLLQSMEKGYRNLVVKIHDYRYAQESGHSTSLDSESTILSADDQNEKENCERAQEGKQIILHVYKAEKSSDSSDESFSIHP